MEDARDDDDEGYHVRFSPFDLLRDAFVAGLAIVVPIIITVFVLNVLAGYVVTFLDAVIFALGELGVEYDFSVLVVRGLTVVVLLALVLGIGFLTRLRYGEIAIDYVDELMASIPGFGSIYDSFREMSEVIVESEERNFRDVKLVEFPQDDTYTLGFLTTSTPQPLQEAVGRNDMVTLFLPLAPNPVMGGNLVHVPEHRVTDVDMTVEEGFRTIVTTGVASGEDEVNGRDTLTEAELSQLAAFEQAEGDLEQPEESETDTAVEPDVLDHDQDPDVEEDELRPDGDLDLESGGRREAGARDEPELGAEASSSGGGGADEGGGTDDNDADGSDADGDDEDRQTEADMGDEDTP